MIAVASLRRLALAVCVVVPAISCSEFDPIWSEDSTGPDDFTTQPFLIRFGQDFVPKASGTTINANSYEIGDRAMFRTHLDGMLLVQPYPGRPAMIMGMGLSRVRWNLGPEVDETAYFIDAIGGLSIPLSVDSSWRIEGIAFAGAGSGSINSEVHNRCFEYGLDANFAFPIACARHLEGFVSAGYHWIKAQESTFQVVRFGTAVPVTLDLEGHGLNVGIGLAWRP